MKYIYLIGLIFLFFSQYSWAQYPLNGTVVSSDDKAPLPGAVLKIKGNSNGVITNDKGEFLIDVHSSKAKIVVSFIGFTGKEIDVDLPRLSPLVIVLDPEVSKLEELTVSTGFQQIPKERATGSFSMIRNNDINQRVSTGILERLEDVVPGLIINKGKGGTKGLLVRGQSTIHSDLSPLIVVDNFPFDGDISSLNPNDIENITILKDAAAASIWGARAGNGVIVISTKKGAFDTPARITFNSNLTVGEKPNIYYQPMVNSTDFIELERTMFDAGLFKAAETSLDRIPFTPVIELLIAARDGRIEPAEANRQIEALKANDINKDYERYFYQKSFNQQYSLQIAGGGKFNRYKASTGYDRYSDNLVRNGTQRYTINFSNDYTLLNDKVDLSFGLNFAKLYSQNNNSGKVNYSSFKRNPSAELYPYAQLADSNGDPLKTIKELRLSFLDTTAPKGFLDWNYQPLEELYLSDKSNSGSEFRFNSSLSYKIFPFIKISGLYQYALSSNAMKDLRGVDTYFTRNEINKFTQISADGVLTRPIPIGDIVERNVAASISNSFRIQLNFEKNWNNKHNIYGIAGGEVRDYRQETSFKRIYGFDSENSALSSINYFNPYQSAINPTIITLRIPFVEREDKLVDRFVSYYGNVSYSFAGKYVLSASGRIDKSNFFGVATNQKSVPLYSAGLLWHLEQEKFFTLNWINKLSLRATYGYAGNSNKSLTAYTTAYFSSMDPYTGLRYAVISNPPNPSLRWERVRTTNFGMDFEVNGRRIYGSLEYFSKVGLDLIGTIPSPGSSGVKTVQSNFVNSKVGGLELNLNTRNLVGKIKWETQLMISHVTEKVTKYPEKFSALTFVNSGDGMTINPMKDRPLFALYSFKWAGLDPTNGDPMGYFDGEVSKDYRKLILQIKPEDLNYHGPARPTWHGVLRNQFVWKGISLSVRTTYRLGYYYKEKTVSYTGVLEGIPPHGDYAKRWQKPGDEKFTNVPSFDIKQIGAERSTFYMGSRLLIKKADNIRLQDINLSYDFPMRISKKIGLEGVQTFLYVNNLGIIWKAAKGDIDPDYSISPYPASKTYSIGLNLNF